MSKATQEMGKEFSETFMARAKRYEAEQASGTSGGGRGGEGEEETDQLSHGETV